MQPRNELQRKVVALSGKLPKIKMESVEWAYEHTLEKMVAQSRNRLFCLECGHKWKPEVQLEAAILGVTCPECGRKLKLQEPGHVIYGDGAYVSVLDTIGGMQVERVLLVKKQCKKLMKPVYWWHEVMQRWIDEKGNITVMTIRVNGFGHAYDSWVYGSHMEIRLGGSYSSDQRHNIGPFRVCPGGKFLPVLKRNGLKTSFYGILPHALMEMILRDSKAETLLKAKQISLLKYLAGNQRSDKVEKYWPSIRICLRNGYKVEDASLWMDYLGLLEEFGKDLRNPVYVCPENLKEAHDRYLKKKKQRNREKKLVELRDKIAKEQRTFAKKKGRYFGLMFTDGKIVVKPLESVEEFMIEGDELGHCVFASEYYKRQDSLILSARINDKPIETIEVSLENMTIAQARGEKNNPTKYHKQILSLVNDNMHRIRELKNQKQAV